MKPTLTLIFLSALLGACSHSDPEPAPTATDSASEAPVAQAKTDSLPATQDQWLTQGNTDETAEPVPLSADPVPEPAPAAPVAEAPQPLASAPPVQSPSSQAASASAPAMVGGALTDGDIQKFISATTQLRKMTADSVNPEDLQKALTSAGVSAPEYSVLSNRITAAVALVGQDDALAGSAQARADRDLVSRHIVEVKQALGIGG